MRRSLQPDEPLGGILADDMGLGKTLTVLATVVNSLDSARLVAETVNGVYDPSKVRTKSTLIIAPSACMLLNSTARIYRGSLMKGLQYS
jgi:SNF2 family DNA or RNA helicase